MAGLQRQRLKPGRRGVSLLCRHMRAASWRPTHKEDVEQQRGVILDRYGEKVQGLLSVSRAHSEALGRQSIRADLAYPDNKHRWRSDMLDVDMMWMSEERFALSGVQEHAGNEGKPARLLRQGWLCEFDIQEPEFDGRRPKSDR